MKSLLENADKLRALIEILERYFTVEGQTPACDDG